MSAKDLTQKRQILASEMVRRLSRVDPSFVDILTPDVINIYKYKLLYSGYPRVERMRIIEGGISSYLKKHRK